MQQITLKCGTLSNVKKCIGSITYCIYGIIKVREIDIALTYDCKNDNLVIHDWFKVSPEENEIITREVSAYFKSIK